MLMLMGVGGEIRLWDGLMLRGKDGRGGGYFEFRA